MTGNSADFLRDRSLPKLNRIKYDAELLIKYLYSDAQNEGGDINIIKICKVRVRRTCGTILAHYYAEITTSNGYKFEFHPGSQPKTFQQIHSDGISIIVLMLCDACCKAELRSFVEGENDFNVAFQNCETILCKRKSMQTIFVGVALGAIVLNMINFSWYYIFFVLFLIVMLYINNNYIISSPRVAYCVHKKQTDNIVIGGDYNVDKNTIKDRAAAAATAAGVVNY